MINGTAMSSPGTPHNQPQNTSPRKTATAFISAARLVNQGVTTYASRNATAAVTPPASSIAVTVLNCTSAARDTAIVTTIGPAYGTTFIRPATTPQTPGWATWTIHSPTPVPTATNRLITARM